MTFGRRVTLLDGGFSTQLCKYVGEAVDGHPLWSARFLATHPDAVMSTHLDYLKAGADIIITNTYQASIGGFKEYLNLDETQSLDLIKKAVKLAKTAVDTYMRENPSCTVRPLIAGSVGPYGASLHDGSEYRGEYVETVSAKDMADWHRPRIEALIAAGVDLLALETIPAQAEAEALVELIKDYPQIKAWISLSCNRELTMKKSPVTDEEDYFYTCHGEKFEDAARSCWARNPDQLVAVGVNCLNPKYVSSLLSKVNEEGKSRIPLIAYPNSGELYHPQTGWTDGDKAVSIDSYMDEWLTKGIEYVGGCCRTDASDTRRMRIQMDCWLERNHQNISLIDVSSSSKSFTVHSGPGLTHQPT